ncbi:MAG: ribosome maturation factor RimM [Actinomycetota bacterium]|nr:ribosome maturation factor RimM [Actinomycetota bacterium]
MNEGAPARLLAAEVGKPHGLSGEVYVVPISDDPTRFDPGSVLLREDGTTVAVESARRHRERLLVKFAGVNDRESAEVLRGPLYVTPDALRELEEDEYWPHELVGCAVFDTAERRIGEIEAVTPGAAQDLLSVRTPRGLKSIPAVKEMILEVDLAARRVTVDPPEGLLD